MVLPALWLLSANEKVPVGSQKVNLMIIFDVKMDLTRKAQICACGDQTEAPSSVTYATIVSRDSICLALLIASLNNMNVLLADTAGAYLNAPCAERVHTVLGPKFGDHQGTTAVVAKALYGLKSTGFVWQSHCAQVLREDLKFIPC